MSLFVIGIFIALILHFVLRSASVADEETKAKASEFGKKSAKIGFLGTILLLVSRIGFARVYNILLALTMLSPMLKGGSQQSSGNQSPSQTPTGKMTLKEASMILGIPESAKADEIKAAHRSLIQKIHPDKGGSEYLAARVNEAKEVMISRL